MQIKDIISLLEQLAPSPLQETYDNAGLITGKAQWECTGILLCLDSTMDVVNEARQRNCNLVIAHHPIVFSGLKKLTGSGYVQETIVAAIKQDIAIYAIHTNLDNVLHGVSGKMAAMLGLVQPAVLAPKPGLLKKLHVFVPHSHVEPLRTAIFEAGGGSIGHYSHCSFNTMGEGTFRAEAGANPYVGSFGETHHEAETRIEIIFESWRQAAILQAMRRAHPYEEIAYDLVALDNALLQTGSGIIASLPEPMEEMQFLAKVKQTFNAQVVRHTRLLGKPVSKVALCGGAGSFLTKAAIAAGADVYITSDVKYHEFFDAENRLLLADIGHFESEQFTIDLLFDILQKKYPTFAVLKTEINTNPVHYFV